jgi:hypothetical protein
MKLRTTIISILALGLLAGSAVGVAAQDEDADPMAFSSFYGSFVEETESGFVIEMTDARASGEVSLVEERTEFRDEPGLNNVVWTPVSVRLVNDGGSWTGTGLNVDTSWGGTGAAYLLTGEGDYEGLTMMFGEGGRQGDDFWGAIVPTEAIPPYPASPEE